MFLEILQTLIRVLLVFSILIIAFGLAFFIVFSKSKVIVGSLFNTISIFEWIIPIFIFVNKQDGSDEPTGIFNNSNVFGANLLVSV